METLAIYYIATSNYKFGFTHFQQNLHYFFPQFKKTVIIISDGLSEWNNITKNGINYKVIHIHHLCWPIITLFKMKFIFDFQIDTDYACYLNADLQCNFNYDYQTSNIDFNKLNVSVHVFSKDYMMYDNEIFESISPESQAYVSMPYKYVHGGFFFGPSHIVYDMCQNISKMCEKDLKKNIIPQFHDESYLNKWCTDNEHLIKRDRFISYHKFKNDCIVGIFNTFLKDRDIKQ